MISTIAGALLPVLFLLALGYGAGRMHAFPKDGVSVITKLVLDFALPASLFVSSVTVSRAALLAEGPLCLAFFLVVAVTWIAVYGISRRVFRRDVAEAGLQALLVALAAVPFYGLAVMTPLFGPGSGIGVSIGSIIVNLVAVPATTIMLAISGGTGGGSDAKAGDAGGGQPHRSPLGPVVGGAMLKAIKTPYITTPLIGVALVLLGVRLPSLLVAPLQLAGTGSSGVGLFVSGLTLAAVSLKVTRETVFNVAVKLIIMPALFLGAAALVHAAPQIMHQGILLAGLPCGPIAVLLATRYKEYETEASTALAVSTLDLSLPCRSCWRSFESFFQSMHPHQ